MYGKFRTARSIYRGRIGGKKWDAADWLRRFLVRNEWVLLTPIHDGIGLEIELHSERGEKLLRDLHREVFPGFRFYVHEKWNNVWCAWFGYSEPIATAPRGEHIGHRAKL